MSRIDDLTMAQLMDKIKQCDKTIEQAESNKAFWVSEVNRQVVLANEVLSGKTEVLWGWEDEVK
jgi:hypothetical protein